MRVHRHNYICTHIYENKYLCMLGFLVNLFLSVFPVFTQKICISCGVNEYFVLEEDKTKNFFL